jgi:hypothetical protein
MMCVLMAFAAVMGLQSAHAAAQDAAVLRPATRAGAAGNFIVAQATGDPADEPVKGLGAIRSWIVASYERAPALLFGLAALLAVPPLVMTGLVLKRRESASGEVTRLQTRVHRGTRSAGHRQARTTTTSASAR